MCRALRSRNRTNLWMHTSKHRLPPSCNSFPRLSTENDFICGGVYVRATAGQRLNNDTSIVRGKKKVAYPKKYMVHVAGSRGEHRCDRICSLAQHSPAPKSGLASFPRCSKALESPACIFIVSNAQICICYHAIYVLRCDGASHTCAIRQALNALSTPLLMSAGIHKFLMQNHCKSYFASRPYR